MSERAINPLRTDFSVPSDPGFEIFVREVLLSAPGEHSDRQMADDGSQ